MTAFETSTKMSFNTLSGMSFNSLENVSSWSDFVMELSSLPVDDPSKNVSKVTQPKKSITVKKAKITKVKRIRRVIPKDKQYIEGEPTDVDVTAGRGGKSNNHEGNKPFWNLILTHRSTYRALQTDSEKKSLARVVAETINESGGQFLLKEKSTGLWFKMPEKAVIDKIQQAFRDKYIVEWAREWAKDDFPEEYDLFLREQQDKKAKKAKRRKADAQSAGLVAAQPSENTSTRRTTTTTTTALRKDTTPNEEEVTSSCLLMASIQSSDFNYSSYSVGGLSLGSMSSLCRDPLFAPMLCGIRGTPSLLEESKNGPKLEQQQQQKRMNLKVAKNRPTQRGRDWVMAEYYNHQTPTEEV